MVAEMANPTGVELVQFLYSPYNEKVRWALDLKGIAHRARSLLPGPHVATTLRLTGQTATPIIKLDGRWLYGSDRILAALEEQVPSPSLFPADPELRQQAIDLAARFDAELGPRIRRAVLDAVIGDAGYTARLFGREKSGLTRGLYRAAFPMIKKAICIGNGLNGPESVEDGHRAAAEALDLVAAAAQQDFYLVGGQFSVADLTAGAILASLANPPGSSMARPKPYPPGFASFLDRWAGHPGVDWVLALYARHRLGRHG